MVIFWFLKYVFRQIFDAFTGFVKRVGDMGRFWRSYSRYKALTATISELQPQTIFLYPRLGDDTVDTPIDPTYFYQDAWAFEKIIYQRPLHHVDVGSHHKYVALLSKVVSVTMVDIRPLSTPLNTLQFQKGSILALPFEDSSLLSVSSLCVIEHIGLGRYGDELDPTGTEKALAELKRVIIPGGDLYVSVPIDDDDRIYFNAHRSFKESTLLVLFAPFEIVEKRYIYGNEFGDALQAGFGTGCYHLRRPLS